MKLQSYLREIIIDKFEKIYVYALTEPKSLSVRYIGISANPELRLALHISNALGSSIDSKNKSLSKWIIELHKNKSAPRMFIIAETEQSNSNALERHYIGFYRAAGASIINQDKSLFEMQEIANSYGGACRSLAYERSTLPLSWECRIGHSFTKSGSRVMRGEWCPICDKQASTKLSDLYRAREGALRNTFSKIYALSR